MAKISVADIAKKVQSLYSPKDKAKDIIGTGANLKRPSQPEDFVLIDTGHPWVKLTGLMGLPYDMIIQVAGAPDSGKSTLASEFMSSAQKQGVYVVLLDTEKKFDKSRYDNHMGGNSAELAVVSTTMIRKGVGAMFKFVDQILEQDKDARILLVHDSVGGSVSRARAEKDFDDEKNSQPGTEAVENSDYMRHVVAYFDKYPGRLCLLLINQMTDKIGPMPGKSRSGGHKITFHSSLIVEMTRIQDFTKVSKGVKLKTGILSRAKVAKNHCGTATTSVYEMRVHVDASGWKNYVGSDEDA